MDIYLFVCLLIYFYRWEKVSFKEYNLASLNCEESGIKTYVLRTKYS